MSILGLNNFNMKNKSIIMRVDFNVPLNDKCEITDDTRIKAALPSIKMIVEGGAKLVLMSHLGRPKGEVVPKMSLAPVAIRLAELSGYKVVLSNDTVGEDAREKYSKLVKGEILMLENLRFSNLETDNDQDFSRQLARFGDCYVNDAFGTAHRAHASTFGITKYITEKRAGMLMQKEIENLGALSKDPARPFVAILGGAKVQGKVDVILNLLDKVDCLLLGGGMIFTFLKVKGINIGDSLVDEDSQEIVGTILEKVESSKTSLLLPEDIVVADRFSNDANRKPVNVNCIPDNWMGLDIGEQTIGKYREIILNSKSLFWNGPMGVFEMENFVKGTFEIGKAIVDATNRGSHSVVGGGDSVAAINTMNLSSGISHISTGGGASLEFMADKTLPGVEALYQE